MGSGTATGVVDASRNGAVFGSEDAVRVVLGLGRATLRPRLADGHLSSRLCTSLLLLPLLCASISFQCLYSFSDNNRMWLQITEDLFAISRAATDISPLRRCGPPRARSLSFLFADSERTHPLQSECPGMFCTAGSSLRDTEGRYALGWCGAERHSEYDARALSGLRYWKGSPHRRCPVDMFPSLKIRLGKLCLH